MTRVTAPPRPARAVLLTRAAFTLLVTFVVLAAATFDGILNPERRLQSVVLLGAVVLLWLFSRWRGKWPWYSTRLDFAILLWCAAFALSLLANSDVWRRSAIGLWYMGLYIAAWYALQDALANGGLRRAWLIDALLITGVPVIFVGFAQIELALVGGLELPRPVGTLGNANAFGAFLVLLLPMVLGRLASIRKPLPRTLLAVYAVGVVVMLLLSFSRGAWIGGAVALLVWGVLRFPVRRTWAKIPSRTRRILLVTGIIVITVTLLFTIQSFSILGRGLELRTWIYETALHIFSQNPLAGSGLFTFGAGLSQYNSLPPAEPHSHAHNVILQVAAELGIIGLVALAFTAWAILRAALRTMRDRDSIAVMGLAAFAGFIAHQMVDLPAMMPALALLALITLALFMPPSEQPAPASLRTRLMPVLVAILAVILAATGIWSAINYRAFITALSEGIVRDEYRAAAAKVLTLAADDSSLAIYPQQVGMLLGLAAAEGDDAATTDAIAQFRRFVALEPHYASGWANLAALYFANGDLTPAADAMRKAVELAPLSWSLMYRYGVYAEAAGDVEGARQAYGRTQSLNSGAFLLPEWNQSPLRREIEIDDAKIFPPVRVLLLLEQGDAATARQVWDQAAADGILVNSSSNHVTYMLLSLAEGNAAAAESALQAARAAADDRTSRAWVYVGAALLEPAHFDEQIANARIALQPALPTDADWAFGENISYIQYLSLAIPRQFLPQVGYTEIETPLLYLLNTPDALARLSTLAQ